MKKEVKKALINANKEVKTISGVCKIIRSFWSEGYKDVASAFGLTFKDFGDVPSILARLQKDDDGNVFVTVNKAVKDEDGLFVLDKDGKRTYQSVNKPVKVWTANRLFDCFEQSLNK